MNMPTVYNYVHPVTKQHIASLLPPNHPEMICLQQGAHVPQTRYGLLGESLSRFYTHFSLFLTTSSPIPRFSGVLAAVFWFPLGIGLCLLDRRTRCTRCGLMIDNGLFWVFLVCISYCVLDGSLKGFQIFSPQDFCTVHVEVYFIIRVHIDMISSIVHIVIVLDTGPQNAWISAGHSDHASSWQAFASNVQQLCSSISNLSDAADKMLWLNAIADICCQLSKYSKITIYSTFASRLCSIPVRWSLEAWWCWCWIDWRLEYRGRFPGGAWLTAVSRL